LGAERANASQVGFLSTGENQLQNARFLDGLDARDSNNRPVMTRKAKDGLTEIFQSGLFNLTTSAELYSAAETLASLGKTLNLAAQNISRDLPVAVKSLMAVFFSTIKQLQKILVCLSGLLGFGLLVFSLPLTAYRLSPVSISLTPDVLRC